MLSNTTSVYFDQTHAMDFVLTPLAEEALRGLIRQQDEELEGLDEEITQLIDRTHFLDQRRAEVTNPGTFIGHCWHPSGSCHPKYWVK